MQVKWSACALADLSHPPTVQDAGGGPTADVGVKKQTTNSVALSPQANYTD
jgi:hypothetical protein